MDKRLLSLDIFRGITIAGMILVNNPGSWSTVYSPLLHADWHGITPTDLVFPFFLFIVGVAIPLALGRRKERGDEQGAIIAKIVRRALIIFGLGLFLAAFPDFGISEEKAGLLPIHYVLLTVAMLTVFLREVYNQSHNREAERSRKLRRIFAGIAIAAAVGMAIIGFMAYDFSSLRIPGVLQRIALVYAVCAILFLKSGWRTQLYLGVGLLFLYWFLMTLVPVPGYGPANLEPETNLGAWLDRLLMSGHLWSQSKVWDPEGLLSTIPAVVTGISGMLTGAWLKTDHHDYKKLTGILGVGAILVALGLIWNLGFPINKKLWTSSYVLYTSGVALLFLGVIYWLVDTLQYKDWTKPFVVYGMNALFVYILSGILAKLLYLISWQTAAGETVTLGGWIYRTFYTSWMGDFNASLAFGLTHVLVLLGVAWILYSRRIFIKV